MYETLKRIYKTTGSEIYLTNAVKKKWITAAEKADIMADTE